jgi:hypothetical protein
VSGKLSELGSLVIKVMMFFLVGIVDVLIMGDNVVFDWIN